MEGVDGIYSIETPRALATSLTVAVVTAYM